jgi:hypothetical protein
LSRRTPLIAAALVLSAVAGYASQTATFRVHARGVPAPVTSRIHADLVSAERTIARELGRFEDTVSVHVYPSRTAFSDGLRKTWGLPETSCWMVGAADDHALHLLAPDRWATEACEHDADDADHVRRLVTHELVHVYHGQANPSTDLGLLEEIGWFTEGLATYLSGQLEARHEGRAAEAIRTGREPARLADAWSGPFRYGVAGSLVAFIDAAWGRGTLVDLLRATSQAELLTALGVSEAQLLDRWRGWVTSG